MNSFPAHRAGRHVAAPTPHAPNAALLIDFDNVTLGVRSDLTKELRHLLNSEIIKGKVAVQRAYADWRRYPQYIVPLSESSIDLIFAPAFGTNKKNATDIRLAVDAIELVFTRPEIGTFILLSGDSDFSSLVLKLKEYGKYVIGVGIRESASDILIQNCDEYFSYSDLAGLTKESDAPTTQRDPWELVVEATAQMQRNDDVMRSDRLKQVMQQIDPNFDESNAGFNRFSKFVTEAGNRGLIKVIRQENGQFDVAPSPGSVPATGAPPREASASTGRAGARGRGGRGRNDRAKPAVPVVAPPAAPTPAATVDDGKVDDAADREQRPGRRRRRGRGRGKGGEEGLAPVTSAPLPAPSTGLTLAEAFHLLSRALGELPTPAAHETVRARMAALHGKEDPLLAATRFGNFLRQANDAEIADVRMLDAEHYEVSPHKTDLAMQMRTPSAPTSDVSDVGGSTPAVPRAPAALRYRSGTRSASRLADVPMFGVVNLNAPDTPSVVAAPSTNGDVVLTPVKRVGDTKATKATKSAKAVKVAKVAKAKTPTKTTKSTKGTKAVKVAKATSSASEKKPSKPKISKPRAG